MKITRNDILILAIGAWVYTTSYAHLAVIRPLFMFATFTVRLIVTLGMSIAIFGVPIIAFRELGKEKEVHAKGYA